jgi:hypothetical protein
MKHILALTITLVACSVTGQSETGSVAVIYDDATVSHMPLSAPANSNNCITYSELEVSLSLTFANGIEISLETGKVTIPDGVELDEASREFWRAVDGLYFTWPNEREERETLIRRLAAEGHICEVLGHAWEPLYGIYPEQRKCRICGKRETLRKEWK